MNYTTEEILVLLSMLRTAYGLAWPTVAEPIFTAPNTDYKNMIADALLMNDGTKILKAVCKGLFHTTTKGISAWDVTQIPLDQIPLYINDDKYYIKIYARWRLQIGR